MEEWQQRLLDEKDALNGKWVALDNFIHSNEFAALDPEDRALLITQSSAMQFYRDVLSQRVERLKI